MTITRDATGRWWISFSFEDGVQAPDPALAIARLASLGDRALVDQVAAHDRGVTVTVARSDGVMHRLAPAKQRRMARWQRRTRRVALSIRVQVVGRNQPTLELLPLRRIRFLKREGRGLEFAQRGERGSSEVVVVVEQRSGRIGAKSEGSSPAGVGHAQEVTRRNEKRVATKRRGVHADG